MEIKITYKGRQYRDFKDALTASIIDGMKEHVEKILAPFKNEIINEGGSIRMDIGKDFKMSLSVENISTDLKERIEAALDAS